MGTKNNPGKFDCYANAEPDEPMFVLLGRDKIAWLFVYLWSAMRHDMEGETDQAVEAKACAAAMRRYAHDQGKDADEAIKLFARSVSSFLTKNGVDAKVRRREDFELQLESNDQMFAAGFGFCKVCATQLGLGLKCPRCDE